jgi:aspartyl-tRNA(Asn)/glutamyl-tRNA(Gln) amidotransferase subunit A
MSAATSALLDLPLAEVAQALHREEAGAVELTEACLARIEALEPHLNCFITVTGEQARRDAQAAGQRLKAGRPLSALDGVPLAVKDLLDVEGVPTTNGLGALRNHVARADAAVVQRLREAGAVLLGKLNMHEAAMGASNDNPWYGRCHNPWRHGHSPGGSSGGSGAAVAAGLCPGALGTDNMGSVRIPAALCGIAGLKPTWGLVSTRGMQQLSWSTGAIGPLARGVDGLAILMKILAGHDPACEESRPAPEHLSFRVPEPAGVAGLRLGVPQALLPELHEASVRAAFQAALATLAELGAEIRPVHLEGLEQGRKQCLLIIEAEAAVACEALLAQEPPPFSPDVLPLLQYGQRMAAPRLVKAQRFRERLGERTRALFGEVDALLTPTSPVPGYSFEEGVPDDLAVNLALANLCGLPALSLPMGFSADGLPLGLQIMAAPFHDPLVLRIGKAYEAATDWHRRRPPHPAD